MLFCGGLKDLGGQDMSLEQYAELTKQQIAQLITDAEITHSELVLADDDTEIYIKVMGESWTID